MIFRHHLLFILLICSFYSQNLKSQETNSPYNQIYLISNLADTGNETSEYLNQLYLMLKKDPSPATVIFLGDLTDNNGISKKSGAKELKSLMEFHSLDHIQLLFTTGDRDWDHSGKKGYKKARFLDDFIQKELDFKNQVIPEKACPGPVALDIDTYTRLIFFNSQWFLHPHDKAGITDTDCKIYSEQIYPIRLATFWDELEDLISEAEGKNVIVAAHHPIVSNGKTGGHKLGNYHFIPIFGSLYKSYRQHVGRPGDLVYPAYHTFAENTKEILAQFESLLYVSGHDQSLDVQLRNGNIHINSGALKIAGPVQMDSTVFKSVSPSILKLELFENGKIDGQQIHIGPSASSMGQNFSILNSGCTAQVKDRINSRLNPCQEEQVQEYIGEPEKNLSGTKAKAIANLEFKAGGLKKKIMGQNYRDIWTQEIEVPYLDLDTTHGGLQVYAKGGSGQTPSLRFYGGDGNEYYFRSTKKNEEMGMSFIQLNSIYRVLTKDMSSTSHPYAGSIISSLLDATEIKHEVPKLYVLPDSPKLGEFREEFKHRLGYLQQRVTKADKTGQTFGNADYIHSTSKVFSRLFQDNQNKIDQHQYAKARMFDMWVGDWDRHEDNWKWAGTKTEKGIVYEAIPKDRDRAFAIYDGLVPSVVDMIIPNQEEFGEDFKSVVNLNFNARNMDRLFANQLNEQDWVEAAEYIQKTMTDSIIHRAVQTLPAEFSEEKRVEISQKLLSRRAQLIETAKRYHAHIAEAVDIVGSNKREIIDIVRHKNGDLEVRMYDRSKKGKRDEKLYQRSFKQGQTKEIRVYTLAGKDEINISGDAKKSIPVRIIGGRGKDKIHNTATTSNAKKYLKVYDASGKDEIESQTKVKVLKPKSKVNYNPQGFVYNGILPFAGIRNSSSNGFGVEAQFIKTIQGFNKPMWSRQWGVKYIWYTGLGAHRVQFKHKWRHAIKETDFRVDYRIANLYDKYPYFFGLGNDTDLDDELEDANFYRTDYFTSQLKFGLEKPFWKYSKLYYGLAYDYHNVKPYEENFSIFNLTEFEGIDGLAKEHLAWFRLELDLDMRDRDFLPQRGSYVRLVQEIGSRLNHDQKMMSISKLNLLHHETLDIGIPVTLSLGAGGELSYGELPFYVLPTLGTNTYLRGSTRNRFIGDRLAYFNSELRFTLGTWITPLLPFYYGFYVFNDIGRVWSDQVEVDADDWHNTYGGGVFLTPVFGKLEIGILVGKSPENSLYSDFKLSLDF